MKKTRHFDSAILADIYDNDIDQTICIEIKFKFFKDQTFGTIDVFLTHVTVLDLGINKRNNSSQWKEVCERPHSC